MFYSRGSSEHLRSFNISENNVVSFQITIRNFLQRATRVLKITVLLSVCNLHINECRRDFQIKKKIGHFSFESFIERLKLVLPQL